MTILLASNIHVDFLRLLVRKLKSDLLPVCYIISGARGTQLLPRLIGPVEAKYPIMFIKIFYRHCAHQLGVIDKLAGAGVRQGENHSRSRGSEAGFKQALNISENFSREGPLALRAAKLAINNGLQVDINTALEWEKTCYETVIKTHDQRPDLNAFAEKLRPEYEGR